jgi:hypothetical protein
MTTLQRSRRLVEALVAMGVEVPEEWAHDGYYCPECKRVLPWEEVTFYEKHTVCRTPVIDSAAPDLTDPANLGALCGLADGVGDRPINVDWTGHTRGYRATLWRSTTFCEFGPTRSIAIFCALEKVAGIEVEAWATPN